MSPPGRSPETRFPTTRRSSRQGRPGPEAESPMCQARTTLVRRLAALWPWAALAALAAAAVWHAVDFDDEVDLEDPTVVRPTFSARP